MVDVIVSDPHLRMNDSLNITSQPAVRVLDVIGNLERYLKMAPKAFSRSKNEMDRFLFSSMAWSRMAL